MIVDDWDPLNLLSHAPDDEYHSEIKKIEQLFESKKEIDELATGIYNIFLNSFGESSFKKSKLECDVIAQKIIRSATPV
jgi:hypothetical protein